MIKNIKQYERAERYLNRLRMIYKGSYYPESPDFYEDEIASFFIHCFHIGDWIIHLSKSPVSKQDINLFIKTHKELRICADFCNGEKHCRLTQTNRTGGQPHLAYRAYSVSHFTTESGVPSAYKASYKIVSGSQNYDVLELAERCLFLWEEYIYQIQKEYSLYE